MHLFEDNLDDGCFSYPEVSDFHFSSESKKIKPYFLYPMKQMFPLSCSLSFILPDLFSLKLRKFSELLQIQNNYF